jgi:hypothetical protein
MICKPSPPAEQAAADKTLSESLIMKVEDIHHHPSVYQRHKRDGMNRNSISKVVWVSMYIDHLYIGYSGNGYDGSYTKEGHTVDILVNSIQISKKRNKQVLAYV